MQLKILLLNDNQGSGDLLKDSLRQLGYNSVSEELIGRNLLQTVESYAPDLMIIQSNRLDEQFLDQLTVLSEYNPLPVVVFTEDENRELINKAINSGVTTYIFDGLESHRLGSIIEVAMVRFKLDGRLRQQLVQTQTNLADRKNIERAKGILMKQRNVDESEAYHALRKMAMDKNMRIGQVSEYVISVSDLLN